ncbi:TetR family transcriptional regulator [Nocardioides stalactiti]|uniref:TetR family transcriptional regulator n=1 Tax=Nocardioides stalactiti TaxID=2755356 RepID=UPI0016040427|nr:TetR family transcriptional regulator [Nocardioides stalactiti]
MARSKAVRRTDIVASAIGLLDEHGLVGWSMRRLAAELGVQPSALYHHFENKAALLTAVAEEVLLRGRRPAEIAAWDAELHLLVVELRDAMRRHRDGAALIALVHAADPESLERPLRSALERGGADERVARVGARSLVRFALSHESDEPDDFALALGIVLGGLAERLVRQR